MATTLNFTKQAHGKYVAEAVVNGPFNLHIERVEDGTFDIKQRTTEEGQYADCFGVLPSLFYRKVIDYDYEQLIFPKHIRIESGSEVTTATLTEAAQ